MMEICESNKDLKKSTNQNNLNSQSSSKIDVILCPHCKRTASNGIRCLGMCVADNDY